MTRKLRPCGTQSAYRRHLNRGEVPCAPCRAANSARQNPAGDSALRVGEQEWGKVLDDEPPKITWRRKPNGVFVATSVHDPHADTSPGAQAGRLRAAAEEAERGYAAQQAERERLEVLRLMRDQADGVAERFRKHRADNTPLMTAARTAL